MTFVNESSWNYRIEQLLQQLLSAQGGGASESTQNQILESIRRDLTQAQISGTAAIVAALNQQTSVLAALLADLSAGNSAGSTYTPPYLTGGALSALKVVQITGGVLALASSANTDHAYRIVGILTAAVGSGATTRPLLEGVITDAGWNWTLGAPIYLGLNGALTQTAPVAGFMLQIATVITSQQIYFQIQEPIFL